MQSIFINASTLPPHLLLGLELGDPDAVLEIISGVKSGKFKGRVEEEEKTFRTFAERMRERFGPKPKRSDPDIDDIMEQMHKDAAESFGPKPDFDALMELMPQFMEMAEAFEKVVEEVSGILDGSKPPVSFTTSSSWGGDKIFNLVANIAAGSGNVSFDGTDGGKFFAVSASILNIEDGIEVNFEISGRKGSGSMKSSFTFTPASQETDAEEGDAQAAA